MAIIDIAILLLIGISFFIGIFRGLVREALSLVTWGVAIWAAFSFADRFTQHFESFVSDPTLRFVASFVAILLVTLILLSMLGLMITALFDSVGLSGVNRTLGGLFGLLRGAIIVAVLILLAGFTDFPNEPWWQQSVLVDHFKPLAKFIHELIPNNLTEFLNKT